MKTLAQVRSEYVADAAAEFLSVLSSRVEEGLKTDAEATLYRKRLPRAILLATTDQMILQVSPGIYDVWSTGKNMDQVYAVDTHARTCTCPDADPERGNAPQGYCKHRLACFLTMRADRGIAILKSRLEGLKLPHGHVYECGHGSLEACWDCACVTAQEGETCDGCIPPQEEEAMRETPPDLDNPSAQTTALDPPAQYEERPVIAPKVVPPCEALSSLNIEGKVRNVRVMWTMRSVLPGAAGDADIISRLPAVLAEMKKLGISFE